MLFRSPVTIEGILAWADAHRARTGEWPRNHSGVISEAPDETWRNVDNALVRGGRGLIGNSTLARLLAEQRGRRSKKQLPELSIPQILAWASAFRTRTGRWPARDSGPIPEAPGETWCTVQRALVGGKRGLPGRSSLASLHRKRSPATAPRRCKPTPDAGLSASRP